MATGPLLLVVFAALCHAGWNYLAQRSGGVLAFVWLFSLCATAIYLPLALVMVALHGLGRVPTSLVFPTGAAVLHALGYSLLLRAYGHPEFSLICPLARGLGLLRPRLAA